LFDLGNDGLNELFEKWVEKVGLLLVFVELIDA
jgi:hypothetical protein